MLIVEYSLEELQENGFDIEDHRQARMLADVEFAN